jgi:hypothetical protein
MKNCLCCSREKIYQLQDKKDTTNESRCKMPLVERGDFQPTSRDNSTLRMRRNSKGDICISIRDNKNLGSSGTMITPLSGKPTSLSTRPTEWLDLTNGVMIHFCPQASPPTIDPGPLQKYDAFKYSLDFSPTFDPLPLTDIGKSSNLKVVFPDAWIGAPASHGDPSAKGKTNNTCSPLCVAWSPLARIMKSAR